MRNKNIYRIGDGRVLACQSEHNLAETCVGLRDMSFVPRVLCPCSPLTHQRYENGFDQIALDLLSQPHPCQGHDRHWTWAAIMNHIDLGGNPMLRPGDLKHDVVCWWNSNCVDASVRAIVSAQFFWEGQHHLFELSTLSANWGDDHEHDWLIGSPNRTDEFQYYNIDASAFSLGHMPEGHVTRIQVDWRAVIDRIAPVVDLQVPYAEAVTSAYSLGFELCNHRPDQSGEVNMFAQIQPV